MSYITTKASISRAGFTAIELAIALTTITLLAGTLAPAINRQIENARQVRAAGDVRALATAMVRFAGDVPGGFPDQRTRAWTAYDLLIGSGLAPRPTEMNTDEWVSEIDQAAVGFLNDHLWSGDTYPPPAAGAIFGWRGPYLSDEADPDPWGRRYAVNVGVYADHRANLIVLSAGQDGLVSTPFGEVGPSQRGDDVTALVQPTRPRHR